MWRDLEVLGEVTNALGKRRLETADPISAKICGDLAKKFDTVPKGVDLDLEMFRECLGIPLDINRNRSDVELTTKGYYRPDLICRLKRAVVLKGEGKASAEDLNLALGDLVDKFHRIDLTIF
ncbi:27147_t:CDS:2, partial [Dentiscutata erythropus]